MGARQRMSDNDILRLLAERDGRSEDSLAQHFAVTRTCIHVRMRRLLLAHTVTRKYDDMPLKRGMPCYLYYITPQGTAALATEAEDGFAQQKLGLPQIRGYP